MTVVQLGRLIVGSAGAIAAVVMLALAGGSV